MTDREELERLREAVHYYINLYESHSCFDDVALDELKEISGWRKDEDR